MRAIAMEKEKTDPLTSFLGTLQEIGLGQTDLHRGIRAPDLSENDHTRRCEQISQHLEDITDWSHYACIDGRQTMSNVDGSQAEVRAHMVGGTGAFLEIALNGDAPIVEQLPDGAIGAHVATVERYVTDQIGVHRSAHLGGCGDVAGAIADNYAIAHNHRVLETVKMLMDQPAIYECVKERYDETLAAHIKHNARLTEEYFGVDNWDGATYVLGVAKDNPRGCEQLKIDANDRFHGHKEEGIIIVVDREKTVRLNDFFVADIVAMTDLAQALARSDDRQNYTQLFMTILAKHIATADRLCDQNMPMYLTSNR